MYVCMYACMYVHMYICMYVCMYVRMYVHVFEVCDVCCTDQYTPNGCGYGHNGGVAMDTCIVGSPG